MIHIFIHIIIHQNKLQHRRNEPNNSYTRNIDFEACNELSLSMVNCQTLHSLRKILTQLKFHYLGHGRMEKSCMCLRKLLLLSGAYTREIAIYK